MYNINKAIKYFTSLRKTYVKLQNKEMFNIIEDALEALYYRKAQENYAIKMFGNPKEKE